MQMFDFFPGNNFASISLVTERRATTMEAFVYRQNVRHRRRRDGKVGRIL
jgi:hypothetical protein